MSTYKDTDALIELIDYYIFDDKDAYKNHSALFIDGMKDGYYRIRSNIINMPSADVIEVVHGEWKGKPIAGYCTVRCSVCGSAFLDNDGRWKYCPNCGARMAVENDK